MARKIERIALKGTAPGTRQELMLHRFGTAGKGPKIYLQASLHADETPGMMVLHHLIPMLDEADHAGRLRGEIVLVPYANPIGLGQIVNQIQLGRYALNGEGNFNRSWPDLLSLVGEEALERLECELTGDAEENTAKIRTLFRQALNDHEPRDTMESLRFALAREAADADFVLDLHCDDDSLMHIFLLPQHWPDARDLVAELGCRAALTAEDSGGASFDEAFSTPWVRLAKRFPKHPIDPACLAVTIELRGRADVSDELGRQDAAALANFLRHRGFILVEAPQPAIPEPLCEATELAATEVVRTPAAGLLSYEAAPGDKLKKSDVVAWLIDPTAENPLEGRQAIPAGTDGLLLSRKSHKYVSANESIAKIVGTEPLEGRSGGYLLED
ncbi:succinylglutamate desuccinylase/aspartoacylase family protein [Denitrobaculum tricleocarpae]|uniref:Succinylglutamate desuccinylase/aspartoacylase family protein n=1 Tax=Denitrobaculum tricleocarpae TaxID=2591009 RepID=A0A545T0S9_9PROT|nr:succinylglutamate desuccinylase/aspartoacylase family protein [Denitrobaculum tricleocarpae]TQV70816.1 succinylglutamate desuccinylase/aspartoacylase family protein [Denitrobaculum tricleocarpae]